MKSSDVRIPYVNLQKQWLDERNDLLPITQIHRLIQIILSLNKTKWFHHPIILDHDGNRLAKRNKSLSIKSFREKGYSANEILSLAKKELIKSKN